MEKLLKLRDEIASRKAACIARTLEAENRTVAIAWPDGWYWSVKNPSQITVGDIYGVEEDGPNGW